MEEFLPALLTPEIQEPDTLSSTYDQIRHFRDFFCEHKDFNLLTHGLGGMLVKVVSNRLIQFLHHVDNLPFEEKSLGRDREGVKSSGPPPRTVHVSKRLEQLHKTFPEYFARRSSELGKDKLIDSAKRGPRTKTTCRKPKPNLFDDGTPAVLPSPPKSQGRLLLGDDGYLAIGRKIKDGVVTPVKEDKKTLGPSLNKNFPTIKLLDGEPPAKRAKKESLDVSFEDIIIDLNDDDDDRSSVSTKQPEELEMKPSHDEQKKISKMEDSREADAKQKEFEIKEMEIENKKKLADLESEKIRIAAESVRLYEETVLRKAELEKAKLDSQFKMVEMKEKHYKAKVDEFNRVGLASSRLRVAEQAITVLDSDDEDTEGKGYLVHNYPPIKEEPDLDRLELITKQVVQFKKEPGTEADGKTQEEKQQGDSTVPGAKQSDQKS